VLPHLRAKRLKRVLTSYSPTFPGFHLYYPSRRNQSTKLQALVDFVHRRQAA
jgi:DNA-binding transcriptional LysR family regulator